MRQIGTLSDADDAARFSDYLLTLNVETRVDEDTDGWSIWVIDEDQVESARAALDEFRANPADSRYAQSEHVAEQMRHDAIQRQKAASKNVIDARQRWERPTALQTPITFGLIAISVVVAAVSSKIPSFNLCTKMEPILTHLFIVPPQALPGLGLEAIREGQVWRLVTPMFIHFSVLHILFNMMWLRELGAAIEYRRGSFRFLLMVLVIAAVSNWGQYMVRGPSFGGMSGVVYGLFGYIWIKSRFDPASGFFMPPNIVIWMIGWFILCAYGAIPGVANWAHGVGLGVGIVIAYVSTLTGKLLPD